MPNNSECLILADLGKGHLKRTDIICRFNPVYGYDPNDWSCPLSDCEAKVVLSNPELLIAVVGENFARMGPDNQSIRLLVYHRVCPGTERSSNTPFLRVLIRR